MATNAKSSSFRRNPEAFYGGGRARACRPAAAGAGAIRRLRERRATTSWCRLRTRRTVARLSAIDRSGGPTRVLALARYVVGRRGQLPPSRDRRRRLRGRREAGRRHRPRAEAGRRLLGPDELEGSAVARCAQELEDCLCEDVLDVERVVRMEVHGAVQFRYDVAVPGREQVDSDEVAVDGGGGAERQRARERWKGDRLAASSECDVRAPLSRRGHAACGADDAASRDDGAKIPADRWDELLRERTVLAKPAVPGRLLERGVELRRRAAEDDVAPPASEPRLEDERKLGRG